MSDRERSSLNREQGAKAAEWRKAADGAKGGRPDGGGEWRAGVWAHVCVCMGGQVKRERALRDG